MAYFQKRVGCTSLGLLAVCLMSCQTENMASTDQKKEFIELLFTLPKKGDIFTDEAFKKAGSYLPVMFSLTEKDLKAYDLYPFDVIIGGVCCRDEYRDYAIGHFSEIRHPELKLFLGSLLFEKGFASPEIVQFLRDALRDEHHAKMLSEIVGPHFVDFKTRVIDDPDNRPHVSTSDK